MLTTVTIMAGSLMVRVLRTLCAHPLEREWAIPRGVSEECGRVRVLRSGENPADERQREREPGCRKGHGCAGARRRGPPLSLWVSGTTRYHCCSETRPLWFGRGKLPSRPSRW